MAKIMTDQGTFRRPRSAHRRVRDHIVLACVVLASTTALFGFGSSAAASSSTTPSAPSNLVATAGNATVDLSWEAAQANTVPVTGYRIYRADSYFGSYYAEELIATVGGNAAAYTDTAVSNGTWYSYRVSAVNALGEEGPRSYSSAVVPEDPNLPSAPTLRVDRVEQTPGHPATPRPTTARVYLSWTPGATDGGAALVEYRVYTYDQLVATIRANQTDYVDHVGACSSNYYRVTAVNRLGEESALSNEVQAIADNTCPG